MLTGAGVSAESGVPVFRGEEGLWRDRRPEDLATPAAFERDPRLVWEWYAWRREVVGRCRPNAAHLSIARWSLAREGRTVVTQNVDGLHLDALLEAGGADVPARARPIELHGSLFRVRCVRCGRRRTSREPIDASSERTLPRCGRCGAPLRPDVVWFGEPLDPEALAAAFGAAAAAEACVVVGTSAVVHPAASVATVAADRGACLIEVGPEPTALTPLADISIRARASEAIPALLES